MTERGDGNRMRPNKEKRRKEMTHREREGGTRVLPINRLESVTWFLMKSKPKDSAAFRTPSGSIRRVIKTQYGVCSNKDTACSPRARAENTHDLEGKGIEPLPFDRVGKEK
jgi:hypothetical protein